MERRGSSRLSSRRSSSRLRAGLLPQGHTRPARQAGELFDDRRVISGIVHVLKYGRWRDLGGCGSKSLSGRARRRYYNRWVELGEGGGLAAGVRGTGHSRTGRPARRADAGLHGDPRQGPGRCARRSQRGELTPRRIGRSRGGFGPPSCTSLVDGLRARRVRLARSGPGQLERRSRRHGLRSGPGGLASQSLAGRHRL